MWWSGGAAVHCRPRSLGGRVVGVTGRFGIWIAPVQPNAERVLSPTTVPPSAKEFVLTVRTTSPCAFDADVGRVPAEPFRVQHRHGRFDRLALLVAQARHRGEALGSDAHPDTVTGSPFTVAAPTVSAPTMALFTTCR